MEFLTWNPSYQLGIQRIDEDHRVFFGLLNALEDAMSRECTRDELLLSIAFLRQHAMTHFQTEEALMAAHGYPELEAHAQAHRKLIEDIHHLVDRFGIGGQTFNPEILRFIGNWIKEHLKGHDQCLAQFLKERGVA